MKLCSRCNKRPAVLFITKVEGDKTTPEGLCLQCAASLNIGPINDMLKNFNINPEDLDSMGEEMMQMMSSMGVDMDMNIDSDSTEETDDDFEKGGATTFPFINNIFGEKSSEENPTTMEEPKKRNRREKRKKRKFLDNYCLNLTSKANSGGLDKIIGREKELYRVIQILSRRSKNNPCLIGEPGVGKTAIAEGLALKIANGDVPSRLSDKEIHLLDLTSLVAGTQFRGQFESRIKGLIDEVKAEGNIILFIDEVHSLVGAGDSEGSMSAANILKPALSRGEIQVIGATTFNEYRKHIEKDAALERRFQPVTIEEPSIEETVNVLNGIKNYYEDHHNVTVSERIVYQAVNLSERYITDRFLPDKAIDLLDEACACASLRNKLADDYTKYSLQIKKLIDEKAALEDISEDEELDFESLAIINSNLAKAQQNLSDIGEEPPISEVTFDDIARVIELWTGIPATKIKESDLKKLSTLSENIKKRIIGQDEAVDLIAKAVRRSVVQINSRRRPASFIFVGPTGVGKTEIVKILSNELFDTPETLIRLDMSEFMEKHSVSRIIGAPPGYVGYDEAGQLTEKVRRKPYSVILFDEIEKAHPDVLNILLGILDDGRVTDAHGRVVNFENTIIIMTSNAGSNNKANALGFGKSESDANLENALKALEELLRPEFIGRVGEIVLFRSLDSEDLQKIAALMLQEIVEPLKSRGITFKYDAKATKLLSEMVTNDKKGARELRNHIRRNVEDEIATILIENSDSEIKKITVTEKNKKIFIKY